MRGSVTLANWIADIKFVQTACPQFGGTGSACSIGFLGFWEQSRPDAIKGIKAALADNLSYELVVTGHSLGAAAAVYAASEFRTAKYPNVLLVWLTFAPKGFYTHVSCYSIHMDNHELEMSKCPDSSPTRAPGKTSV
jgi:hypothetical protein